VIRRGERGVGWRGGPLWSPAPAYAHLPNHTVGKQKEGRRATIKVLPAPPSHPRPYGR